MLLTEISRQGAHICDLFLIESVNPLRLTLIVKSKNISDKSVKNQKQDMKSTQI